MTDDERKERRRLQQRASYERNKHKYADKARNRATKWYADNKHRPEVAERYRTSSRNRNPVEAMFLGARNRADKKNIPFDITRDDIVVPDVCPVFGTPFEKGTQWAPSLDRVRPELGYVKGNVAVISRYANTIKNVGTSEQHRRIAEWMDSLE